MAGCYCAAPGDAGAHQGLVVRRIRQPIARNRTLPAPQADGALRADQGSPCISKYRRLVEVLRNHTDRLAAIRPRLQGKNEPPVLTFLVAVAVGTPTRCRDRRRVS